MSVRIRSAMVMGLLLGIAQGWGQHAHIIQPKTELPGLTPKSKPPKRRKWWSWGKGSVPLGGGARECARRRAQIERGIATPGSVVFRKNLDGTTE